MTVIHANDPTTKVLSYLYETRKDVSALINESSTNLSLRHSTIAVYAFKSGGWVTKEEKSGKIVANQGI